MANKPVLRRAVAKTKIKANDYNWNFEQMNNYVDEVMQEAESTVESKVSKSGDTMTGTLNLAGISGTGNGQQRFVSSNYGTIFRQDNDSFYMLITNSGDPYGNWNDLRPFKINLANGSLHTTHPPYDDDTDKVATTHFVKYILANSGFGLADIVKGNDGYIDFAIGFKVRWGQVTFANGSHTASVTFPKPFAISTPKVVLLRKSGADTTVTSGEIWCRGTSTTGFNLYQHSTQPYGYMWIAIGY